jgi:hypothetical protein
VFIHIGGGDGDGVDFGRGWLMLIFGAMAGRELVEVATSLEIVYRTYSDSKAVSMFDKFNLWVK